MIGYKNCLYKFHNSSTNRARSAAYWADESGESVMNAFI